MSLLLLLLIVVRAVVILDILFFFILVFIIFFFILRIIIVIGPVIFFSLDTVIVYCCTGRGRVMMSRTSFLASESVSIVVFWVMVILSFFIRADTVLLWRPSPRICFYLPDISSLQDWSSVICLSGIASHLIKVLLLLLLLADLIIFLLLARLYISRLFLLDNGRWFFFFFFLLIFILLIHFSWLRNLVKIFIIVLMLRLTSYHSVILRNSIVNQIVGANWEGDFDLLCAPFLIWSVLLLTLCLG